MTTATQAKRQLKVRGVRKTDDGETLLAATWWEGNTCRGMYAFQWSADDMEGVCRITTPEMERYTVTCGPSGEVQSCTCPDFVFKRRRKREQCKHLQCVAALVREGKFRMG